MKIVRISEEESKAAARPPLPLFRSAWFRWAAQLVLLTAALILGMLLYRTGAVRPAYVFLRQLVTDPQAAVWPKPVSDAVKNVTDEVRMYQNNGLPTLYLDVPFKSYQKLLAKRDEAVQLGILNTTDADFVPAQIQAQNGPKMDAKIRLKGDWADHLQGDKWSFRIDLKTDGQIFQAKKFSIQSPETRNYLNEWAFHQHLMKEGVLTTRYNFANVLLNGKLLGIYAVEDHFATELIESQGRRAGVILRYNEDLMWQSLSNIWANHVVQGQGSNFMVVDQWSSEIEPFETGKIAKSSDLAAESEAAVNLLRAFQMNQKPASEVFDVALTGRFFALIDLWSACHGVAWHNLRFYYNPVTGRLEPVAYDAEPFESCDAQSSIVSTFPSTGMFNDPAIRAAYASELERITQPEYIENLIAGMQQEHDQLNKSLGVEFSGQPTAVNWDQLRARARALLVELRPAQPVRGTFQVLNAQPGSTDKPALALDVINLMILPVNITQVQINDKVYPVTDPAGNLAPVADPANRAFIPTRITIPLSGSEGLSQTTPPVVKVVAHIGGVERNYRVELSGAKMPDGVQLGPAPQQPTLAEALRQHPYLEVDPKRKDVLRVLPGAWNVNGDLILPDNTDLYVSPGTVLRFSKGSILYLNGALYLLGTQEMPILLTSQDDQGWGGMVVLNTNRDSLFQYAKVEKTAGISRGGWILTGGITFYKSTIVLDHALLGNNHTEDAINVIHGTFKFQNSEWENTQADAFDSDFSSGEITGCYFHDIGGDAVDISGTTTTLTGSHMERIVDKGVSTGEQSTITIKDVQMDTVGIGVASKDLSKSYISQSTIRKARFSALAAYIKKPVYGPGLIEASSITIQDTEKEAVAQKGSTILLDGKAVPTVDLDVDLLYSEGILGN